MEIQSYDILGVAYAGVDYAKASDLIISHARERKCYAVFALPVHGLVESWQNPEMKIATQKADLICPDGQPIRWLMNHLHKANQKDRVYGPTLTLKVLEKVEAEGLNIFLYGGATQEILDKFCLFIQSAYPGINISGTYREKHPGDDTLTSTMVNASGAHLLLVGRGCPNQEIWISNKIGKINAAMMAIGAAFAFHAGLLKQAPAWMQRFGLEWLFRLSQEPTRLWKRYLMTNSSFLIKALPEVLKLKFRNDRKY